MTAGRGKQSCDSTSHANQRYRVTKILFVNNTNYVDLEDQLEYKSPSKKLSFWGERPQCCAALQAAEDMLVPTARIIFPSVWIYLPLSCCNLDL